MTEQEAGKLLDDKFAKAMDNAGYRNSIGYRPAFGNGHQYLRQAAIAAVLQAANTSQS